MMSVLEGSQRFLRRQPYVISHMVITIWQQVYTRTNRGRGSRCGCSSTVCGIEGFDKHPQILRESDLHNLRSKVGSTFQNLS